MTTEPSPPAPDLAAMGNYLRSLPIGHYTRGLMSSGATPALASAADPRFSFRTYVPQVHGDFEPPEGGAPAAAQPDRAQLPLVVLIHGTKRDLRGVERMADFAEAHGCLVLAPLFPCGIVDPTDIHAYKRLRALGIRFDLLLLSMLAQAAHIWRVRVDRFYLHGFSGGAQFAHRFLYLHPARLLAVSIGAPGALTLPDAARRWPHGLADVRAHFGLGDAQEGAGAGDGLDWRAIRRVPVQCVVGALDTRVLSGADVGDAHDPTAGASRVQKIHMLRDAFVERGVRCRLDVVEGVGHQGLKVLPAVQEFFGPILTGAL